MTSPRRSSGWMLWLGLALVGGLALYLQGGAAGEPSGLAIDDDHLAGPARVIENLTLFPIYAKKVSDFDPIVSLQSALKARRVVVREMSAERAAALARQAPGSLGEELRQQAGSPLAGGPTVGTLVIENKGDKPLLVLAGTMLHGGRQDRLVSQDFVVDAGKTVPVDAFCIEQGRWSPVRLGEDTGDKFAAEDQLANANVRLKGQYQASQSGVWENVREVNANNMASSQSGSLFATLDKREVRAKQRELTSRIGKFLADLPDQKRLVGLAYAVDGKMRGVRWFLNHGLFAEFEKTLANTAAVEAITAQSAARQKNQPIVKKPVKPEAVRELLTGLKSVKVKSRKVTGGLNVNRIRETEKAYSMECLIQVEGKSKAVTTDFLAH